MKNKLLKTILPVVGVSTAITPIVCLASCGWMYNVRLNGRSDAKVKTIRWNGSKTNLEIQIEHNKGVALVVSKMTNSNGDLSITIQPRDYNVDSTYVAEGISWITIKKTALRDDYNYIFIIFNS